MSHMSLSQPSEWAYYVNDDDRPVAYRYSDQDSLEITDYGRELGLSADGAKLAGLEPFTPVQVVRVSPLPPRYMWDSSRQ